MRVNLGRCLLPDILASRGWTQIDLSQRTEIHHKQISDWATNRRVMSLATAIQVAGALGCEVYDLYENAEPLYRKGRK